MSIFKPKARALVGLDISSSAVKMVELSGAGREGLRLERYSIETLPRDSVVDGNIVDLEGAAMAVQRAWQRLGSSTRQVAMALPATAVITKRLLLPAGQREQEMEIMVEQEAGQYIPFPLDEVGLDFQVIGPAASSPDEVEVLVAATRREKVEDRVAVAESAGLKPVVMDIESHAVLAGFGQVSRLLPGCGQGEVLGLVDIGASVTRLIVLRDGEVLYVRDQACGGNQLTQDMVRQYGISWDEAAAVKRSHAFPPGFENELLAPFRDVVAHELQRALHFFFSSTPFKAIDHLFLTGGSAMLPDMAVILAERLGRGISLANPFAGMALSSHVRPKSLQGDAGSLMLACGLALRRFDE